MGVATGTGSNMARRPLNYTTAGHLSSLSAVLFIVAAILTAVANGIESKSKLGLRRGGWTPFDVGGIPSVDYNATEAEVQYRISSQAVIDRWVARREAYPPRIFGQLFGALGWFCALPAVGCLAQSLGGEARSGTSILTYAFLAAGAMQPGSNSLP